jgi:hypothetical protein
MKKNAFIHAAMFAAALCATQSASAQEVGFRKVLSVGCHNTDNTCFITLDGAPFGQDSGCSRAPDTEVRFENGDTPEGRRAYASMLMALQAGTTVTVAISGCTNQGSMKLQYFRLYKG